MFASAPISAAPFVYGLLAIGLICAAVVGVYVARDASRKRTAEKPTRRGNA